MTLEVRRTGEHEFTGSNERGAQVRIGRRDQDGSFSPGELLQIATAGCSAVTAEELIIRRAGDDAAGFRVEVGAEPAEGGHDYDSITVRFDVDLHSLDDERRAELGALVARSIERLCTVSRTLAKGIPVHEQWPTAESGTG